jgi:hypothetical protein
MHMTLDRDADQNRHGSFRSATRPLRSTLQP